LELPPHIFAIGEGAYRSMKNDKENQCIIISYRSLLSESPSPADVLLYVRPRLRVAAFL
jgi:hypothetical protein